jgi:two-component system chemotaxis response regulator CheB
LLSEVEQRDIVVVGASTGGVDALRQLVQALPQDFPGTIFVAMHIGQITLLPEILSRSTQIRVEAAGNGVHYEPGHIYIAPPNRHLLIQDGQMKLSAGPRENGHRPAIDPLFRSAARELRSRVVGVILSGALDDGSAGLFAVKSRNGVAIVQHPEEAEAPDMPLNAMKNVSIDYCLTIAEIASLLDKLARGQAGERQSALEAGEMKLEKDEIVQDPPPSDKHIAMACPECEGPLYETTAGQLAHFQCNVGHAFSALSLSAAHSQALERALWVAVRTLNERVTLHRQMLRRQRNPGEDALVGRLEETLKTTEHDVELLRQIIERI